MPVAFINPAALSLTEGRWCCLRTHPCPSEGDIFQIYHTHRTEQPDGRGSLNSERDVGLRIRMENPEWPGDTEEDKAMKDRRAFLTAVSGLIGSTIVAGGPPAGGRLGQSIAPNVRAALNEIAATAERSPAGLIAVFDFAGRQDFLMSPPEAEEAGTRGLLVVDHQDAKAIREFLAGDIRGQV